MIKVIKLATIEVKFGLPSVKNPEASNPSNELILSIVALFHCSLKSVEKKLTDKFKW